MLLGLFSLLFAPPLHVHADGGAPNLAYVSGTPSGISVIDVGQAKITKNLRVAGDPQSILLSQDGSVLYVTQPGIDQIAVLAAKTGQSICVAHVAGSPSLLALDQSRKTIYVGGEGATEVRAFDAITCAPRGIFATQSPVYGLALAFPGGAGAPGPAHELWVAGAQGLTVFDTGTGHSFGTVALPDGPHYLSIPPGSQIVYVTTRQGTVDAVESQSRTVHRLLVGGTFGTMDYDALSGEVYVPDTQHVVVDVLAPLDPGMTTFPREPNRVFQLPAPPELVAITNDGQLGFVTMRGGTIAMLDVLGRQLAYTVVVGGTPHCIITGLYPPALVPTAPTLPARAPQPASIASLFPTMAFAAFLIVVLVLVFLLVQQLRAYKRVGARGKGPAND